MKRIERSAIVAFSREQMFHLVNDVSQYPKFVPGCVSSEILDQHEALMVARLSLSKAGMKQSFVTRNSLSFPDKIVLSLEDGPFKTLRGEWNFTALSDNACKVLFWCEFEFSNVVLTKTIGKIYEKIATEQVNAMCDRAKKVYI